MLIGLIGKPSVGNGVLLEKEPTMVEKEKKC